MCLISGRVLVFLQVISSVMQHNHIRNFSIIAHIDHGKSTLSDRLIQHCGGLSEREMAEQVLDSQAHERARAFRLKALCVTLS